MAETVEAVSLENYFLFRDSDLPGGNNFFLWQKLSADPIYVHGSQLHLSGNKCEAIQF